MVRKIKLMHIITGLSTGGAERALLNLLAGGLVDDFENCVVSLGDAGTIGPKIRELGVPVHSLQIKKGLNSVLAAHALHAIARDYSPGVVQGWMYHGNLAAFYAWRTLRKKPVLAWNIRHSLSDLNAERFLTRQTIRVGRRLSDSVDLLLYNSSKSRVQHEDFGFASKHAEVIPNGIELKTFLPRDERRSESRGSLGLSASDFVIGHVARLHPMKNHASFLRATERLVRRYSNIHVVLAGRGVVDDNSALTSLLSGATKRNFHFLGERADVANLLAAMDIFCVSSAWGEGFPNVIGEAMATGVPCVATDVGDCRYIIDETGITVRGSEDEELLNGLEKMYLLPERERQHLGKIARERIESRFSLDSVVSRYASSYAHKVGINESGQSHD